MSKLNHRFKGEANGNAQQYAMSPGVDSTSVFRAPLVGRYVPLMAHVSRRIRAVFGADVYGNSIVDRAEPIDPVVSGRVDVTG